MTVLPDIAELPSINNASRERVRRVLDFAFRGSYHVPSPASDGAGSYEVNLGTRMLDTFDWDRLTRLVVAAHDQCVRIEICSSGPRLVKIVMSPRELRIGSMTERHPTIEEAIAGMKHREIWHPPLADPDARTGELGGAD